MLCDQCGAPVEINEVTGIAKCKYCNTMYDLAGHKVDFSKILDFIEEIRRFKRRGELPEPKISVVKGKVQDDDEYIDDGKPPYTCIECGKKFNLAKIIRHMFTAHHELCESQVAVPYIRNHPELIYYLESFVNDLHSRKELEKELKDKLDEKDRFDEAQKKQVLKISGKHFFNFMATTFVGFAIKVLAFIFFMFLAMGAIIVLSIYLATKIP